MSALSDADSIALQSYAVDGITDIEIWNRGQAVAIVEAKIGHALPSREQLSKYARREDFANDPAESKGIVVLTDFDAEVAARLCEAGDEIEGRRIVYLGWRDFLDLAQSAAETTTAHRERRLLKQFRTYLEGSIMTRNVHSNEVYVVSLSKEFFGKPGYTFIDYVARDKIYFHPIGNGYPSEPPNYVGFRYDGRLQSIHFVDAAKTVRNLSSIEGFPHDDTDHPHFVYTLGPSIGPAHEVRSGKGLRNRRVRIPIDLLLTCATVRDAELAARKRAS